MEKILAQREGIKRGWLTYTELLNLLPSFTIAKFFLNNIAIMAVSYAASVMTIAGAFFIVSYIPGNALINRGQQTENNIKNNNLNMTTPITTKTTNNIMNFDNNDSDDDNINNELLCQAINIENELKMLEKEYNEEKNEMNLPKFCDNYSDTLNFRKSTNLNIPNNQMNINNNRNEIDDVNCRNSIKNYTDSLLWYTIMDQGKSLIEISFDWFKFI